MIVNDKSTIQIIITVNHCVIIDGFFKIVIVYRNILLRYFICYNKPSIFSRGAKRFEFNFILIVFFNQIIIY